MNHDRTDNVIAFRQDDLDTESKVLAAFERVQTELASIDTIEDALKLRTKAELLRILATKVRCAKSTLDEIAAVKVRAERRLGELLATRPETRGGDHKSVEFQKSKDDEESFDPAPTLDNLGVPKHVSRCKRQAKRDPLGNEKGPTWLKKRGHCFFFLDILCLNR